MNPRGVLMRMSRKKLLLISAAFAIAAVAALGPGGGGSGGAPSSAKALSYVTGHRLDLGAPGIAVGVVTDKGMSTASAGDVTVDTPIPVGSVTKSFTALAVMQLAEAGKLKLDEPVVRYLPTFTTADRSYSDRITVRELLSHTSGIPTIAGVDPLSGPETTLTAQVSALHRVASIEPGSFAYSNANYEVLGELVERLSGQSYAAYLHEHVLAPLDMTHTYTDLRSAKAGGLGDGHRIWFGVGIPTGIFYRADFLPAGFLVSTVGDLDHYLLAILQGGRFNGHSILSPRGIHSMISPQTPASALGVAGSYGFGWYQRPTGGLNLDIDPGIAQNVHADLVLSPDHHTGLVLLADAESDLYEGLIPKFDIAALNATSIAAVGHASSGLVEGLYVIFDLVVAGALFIYSRTFVRVVKRRVRYYPRSWYSAVAVWREVLVPAAVLLRLPGFYHESWNYLLTGDVGFCAALIATLGLTTLAARVVNGLRAHQAPLPVVRLRRTMGGLLPKNSHE
ncbi:MAG: hypothetical protein QOK30_136 [Nocardioidaceae bacterium]|nr:hypothetical protein [Nocardioidaceae bacterium]